MLARYDLTDALTMGLSEAATAAARAPSFPPFAGLVCHTPQPTPPIDDDDDDEDDDDDRGSGGGNVDPDDDEGELDEDEEDEDDTLWLAATPCGARRVFIF